MQDGNSCVTSQDRSSRANRLRVVTESAEGPLLRSVSNILSMIANIVRARAAMSCSSSTCSMIEGQNCL